MRSIVRVPIFLFLIVAMPLPAKAQEAWLVTYGPGSEVWERFGHNALWLKDEEIGLDHTFSFGYFELDRPGFHLEFARGIMHYYGAAARSDREFEFYGGRDRSIVAQRLDLSVEQVRWLHHLLTETIFPIPQYYDYDYYFANCSTWLRDLIDEVTAGELEQSFADRPARQNFRQHTSRLNVERPWLHTGLMLLLGPEIDRDRTAWEEMFLPDALAYWLAEHGNGQERPLVTETRVLYHSTTHYPPPEQLTRWWFYLPLGVVGGLLVLLPLYAGSGFWNLLPWRLAVLTWGLAGVLIVLMWLATAHYVVAGNLMLFLLHPLWLALLLPIPRSMYLTVWWLLAAAAAAGTVLLAMPDGPQYRLDLLLWLVPMTAAMLAAGRLEAARVVRSSS